MKHSEGFIKGLKNANIYYQNWLPEGEIKGVLLVAHGLGEHSGRYVNVAQYFVPKGYGVYTLDHYGHGKSDGQRMYVRSFADYTAPLRTYSAMIRDQYPEKPLFLIGQSLGALIGSIFLIEDQTGFSGVIFTAAGVRMPENITPLTIAFAKMLSIILPKVGVERLEYEFLSRDKEVVQAFFNDPLVYTGKTTARMGIESLSMMRRVEEEASKISLPIFILHGGDDRMVALPAAQMLEEKVSSEDKTLKVYENHYHDLLHDTGVEKVLQDIEEWLEKRL